MATKKAVALVVSQLIILGFIFVGIRKFITFDENTNSLQMILLIFGILIFYIMVIFSLYRLLKNKL